MPSPEGEGRDLRSGFLRLGGAAGYREGWVALNKATALVKLLALAPHHSHHREQVMETLWPELDPKAAANNLYRTLHAARRVLEPGSGGAGNRYLPLEEGADSPVPGRTAMGGRRGFRGGR
jgi:hypothetical protein